MHWRDLSIGRLAHTHLLWKKASSPRLKHQGVLQHLACEVISVLPGIALLRPLAVGGNLIVVVLGLHAETAILDDAVCTHLESDALDDGTTQPSRIDGCVLRNLA